jgi:hypothetical protein
MNLLRRLAVVIVLLAPMVANAGYIKVDVAGGANNEINVPSGSDFGVFNVIGHLLFGFTESAWIDAGNGERYQFPTLLNYEFEWSAASFQTQEILAEDSCETGDGYGGLLAVNEFIEYSSGSQIQYDWTRGFWFSCQTPISAMSIDLSPAEEVGFLFYDLESPYAIAVSNHDLSYDMTIMPEPGTLALLGIGLAGIGLTRRRRKA